MGSDKATMHLRHLRIGASLALVALAASLAACMNSNARATIADAPIPVIPLPASVSSTPGVFRFAADNTVATLGDDTRTRNITRYFVAQLARSRRARGNVPDPIAGATSSGPITFQLTPPSAADDPESYVVDISPQRIDVKAADPRGLFYGAVTLWQLLAAAPERNGALEVAAMRIDDRPQLRWRGVMLDVARHYLPPPAIKRIMDAMALHKLNTLHWHLTDDQGWRLQILRYPRLTEIGAWRVPAGAAAAADIDPATGKPRTIGGFYTQDEVRDLVRYAAERNITIVPEIDMPGHAQAAIAAYPELGSRGDHPGVSSDWGVHTYLYNVDESTFEFIANVLDEVVDLFPGEYIHVGSDEAAKDQWQASAQIQRRMQALGIKDEAGLQSYFVQRLQKMLEAHGRKLIGWDEILQGGMPPSATVMSWNGIKGAIEAAKLGHDVVLAPSPDLYLDHVQGGLADEPPGRPQAVTLADVYGFNPLPAALDDNSRHHMLGAQVNLWTEHMRTAQRVEHAAFPRAAALAEVLWTPAAARDWRSFQQRLAPVFARYRELGIDYADSVFAVRFDARPATRADQVKLTLSTQGNGGLIRYTLDGSSPNGNATRYTQALTVPINTTVRAAAFDGDIALSATRESQLDELSLLTRNSDELAACKSELPLRLEDDAPLSGTRAVFRVDILDPCWIYRDADLSDAAHIAVVVGQLPYNFQLWHDTSKIVIRPSSGADGELEVRLNSCAGEILATLPLTPARGNPALSTLRTALPQQHGSHDLCLRFNTGSHDPLWVIDSVQLQR